MKRKVTVVIACLCAGMAALGGFVIFFATAHALPLDQLERIQPGMTETEIRQRLGAPGFIRNETAGTKVYSYGGFAHCPIFGEPSAPLPLTQPIPPTTMRPSSLIKTKGCATSEGTLHRINRL